MSEAKVAVEKKTGRKLSLDTWAVLIAVAAAALIRFGIIPRVPW
jgi:hypothetical protein